MKSKLKRRSSARGTTGSSKPRTKAATGGSDGAPRRVSAARAQAEMHAALRERFNVPESVRLPQKATTDRYGWGPEDWCAMGQAQDWKCLLCDKTPTSGIFVTDHYHARGWKAMAPEDRRQYIRGLLCFHCNRHLVHRWINVEKAKRVLAYLIAFEERRPK